MMNSVAMRDRRETSRWNKRQDYASAVPVAVTLPCEDELLIPFDSLEFEDQGVPGSFAAAAWTVTCSHATCIF